MSEDQLEQEVLRCLDSIDYLVAHGADNVPAEDYTALGELHMKLNLELITLIHTLSKQAL